MQGFILNYNKARDEDLIVTILCKNKIYTTYRFYGVRHATINIGKKIDFELETNYKSTIDRLKDVVDIGFSWFDDNSRVYCWQNFIKIFYVHLYDIEHIDKFYCMLLDECVKKLTRQNPKRAIIETYVKMLHYEGRMSFEDDCLLCDQKISGDIALVRGFKQTHEACSYKKAINRYAMQELLENKSTAKLSDNECERIWQVLLQGL
ncbi:MAG: recombination protein RecO [Epsilonproteobacteria bacterium]|nr:MAG: recombination protein RecO [Campylobacterota bacterium]